MLPERWKSSLGRSLAVVTLALSLCPVAPATPKYKGLHSFNGTDGEGPWGGVALDQKGDLWTAPDALYNLCAPSGYGPNGTCLGPAFTGECCFV
jgi:hypothetical protein